MIKVLENLYIGNQEDWEKEVSDQEDWAVIHACKEPHHRRLLGYTTPGAPQDDPEYLIARRGNRLYLNLVDAPQMKFIPEQVINAALDFIAENIKDRPVFIHCNQGESRAPSIAIMYLYSLGDYFTDKIPGLVIEEFMKIYPNYNPGQGMLDYTINFIERR